jgi:polar amino acid transport system substrate-binding protein
MKKLFAILVTLTLVVTLAACGGDEEQGPLRVGMDLSWPPFETKDTNGDPIGISVDVAYELGDYLDREVEIVDVAFGGLIPALNTGDIDVIIASMSITEEREEAIDFSDPYFYFPLITVLNSEFNAEANITSKDDLFTYPEVTFIGPRSLVSLSIPEDEANDPIIKRVDNNNIAVQELVEGLADAFIISASAAVDYHEANPNTTELMWDIIDDSPIGMGVREGESELLADINAFIAGMEENGVYDRLRAKYDAQLAEGLDGQGLDFYIRENEDDE